MKQGANQFDNNGTGAFGGAGELCFNFSNCYAGTKTRIVTGWTAGGGLEYLLSQHWTLKAEYLFVSLASDDFNMPISAAPGTSSYTARVATETFHVTRAGVNYKF